MGQKANIITLRPQTKSINLALTNSKLFTNFFKFLTLWEFLLKKKNILLFDKTLNIVHNQIYFNLEIFYKSIKTAVYKRKGKLSSAITHKHVLNNSKLENIFELLKKRLDTNLIILSIKNLNKEINNNIAGFFFSKFKRFLSLIFARQFNLFIDFIKITALLSENKITPEAYINILSTIFKFLSKKIHTRFLFFLKFVFKTLIFDMSLKELLNHEQLNIVGVKFIIQGKLQGKPRSSSYSIQEGSVSIQKINSNILFARTHTYTLLGAFGLRIWICKL